MVPIRNILELGEADTLLTMLNEQIIKYSCLSKLDNLAGKLSNEINAWNQSHAAYLKEIYEKLTGTKYKP